MRAEKLWSYIKRTVNRIRLSIEKRLSQVLGLFLE